MHDSADFNIKGNPWDYVALRISFGGIIGMGQALMVNQETNQSVTAGPSTAYRKRDAHIHPPLTLLSPNVVAFALVGDGEKIVNDDMLIYEIREDNLISL